MVSSAASPFHSPSPHHTPYAPAKKAMSITQTYFLAHKARAKLSTEAARPDHNLRLLVGHANLLDSLMLDLADAEREQESWFNQSVRGAAPETQERHIQWADAVAEDDEDEWAADSSDSDSDSDMDDDEDIEMADAPLSRAPAYMITPPSPKLHTMEADEELEDEEDFDSLSLTRSPSHSASPPDLEHDSESSEDEAMPPSPPTDTMPTFSEKPSETTITTKYLYTRQDEEEEDKSDFYNEGFYLPPRNPNRLISTISVY